ncbi:MULTISPECIES: hypothetical protein [Bacillus cereus group]|uniref:hypothetical protein n=1 Tax=Bacillus cereus group TaxID=86661 RepID=UPI001E3606A9|nr:MULTISPECIES: hypothetical protein [Bacillus cereus group]MCU5076900.1 hypothetical protein [Bacillus cereus]MDA1918174.1 hypothetical protein [Bacillus cereus group sp. BcHK140]MEC4620810.1 hypothetical protein [Bacillus paranthracis]
MNMLRSSFGGHFAGSGIVQDADMRDDFIIRRGVKINRGVSFSTDKFSSDKEGKKAFDDYCEAMSSKVTTYNMYEQTEPVAL